MLLPIAMKSQVPNNSADTGKKKRPAAPKEEGEISNDDDDDAEFAEEDASKRVRLGGPRESMSESQKLMKTARVTAVDALLAAFNDSDLKKIHSALAHHCDEKVQLVIIKKQGSSGAPVIELQGRNSIYIYWVSP